MGSSTYFNKHYDASMQKPFRIGEGRQSAQNLAESMNSDLKDNYLDTNMPGNEGPAPDQQILREEDVDEEMFIFPDRAAAGEEEKVLDVP